MPENMAGHSGMHSAQAEKALPKRSHGKYWLVHQIENKSRALKVTIMLTVVETVMETVKLRCLIDSPFIILHSSRKRVSELQCEVGSI